MSRPKNPSKLSPVSTAVSQTTKQEVEELLRSYSRVEFERAFGKKVDGPVGASAVYRELIEANVRELSDKLKRGAFGPAGLNAETGKSNSTDEDDETELKLTGYDVRGRCDSNARPLASEAQVSPEMRV